MKLERDLDKVYAINYLMWTKHNVYFLIIDSRFLILLIHTYRIQAAPVAAMLQETFSYKIKPKLPK